MLKLSGSLIVISMVLVGIILAVLILVKASILQVIQYVLVFTAASSRWPPHLAAGLACELQNADAIDPTVFKVSMTHQRWRS